MTAPSYLPKSHGIYCFHKMHRCHRHVAVTTVFAYFLLLLLAYDVQAMAATTVIK